jgi:hypothetical protein
VLVDGQVIGDPFGEAALQVRRLFLPLKQAQNIGCRVAQNIGCRVAQNIGCRVAQNIGCRVAHNIGCRVAHWRCISMELRAACQSLVLVDGEVIGDPLEKAPLEVGCKRANFAVLSSAAGAGGSGSHFIV